MNTIKKNRTFLFFVAFFAYFNTLWNGYSFDDNFIENTSLKNKGIEAIKEIFTSHYWQERENTFGYRPLARFSYYIESQLFGKAPAISHLINILLFSLTILLLFKILQKIFPNDEKLIWWVSVLFALHPIHTEVVASLKNREELFVLLFGLSSIWMILKYIEESKFTFIFFSILFLWLSILSKENGIVFCLLIPLTIFTYKNFEVKIVVQKPLLFVYFLVIIISSWILFKLPSWILTPENKVLFPFENPLHENYSKISRLLLSAESLGFYLWKLIIPFPLLFYYGYNMLDIPTGISFYSTLFVIMLLISILFLFLKSFRNKHLTWSILWFWGSLIPFSNFFIPINGIVAERLTYTASVGFIFILTYFILQLKKSRPFFLIGFSFLFFILTFQRNFQWKSIETLLRADMPYLEKSAKANATFATMLLNKINTNAPKNSQIGKKSIDSIIIHYKKSIEIYPKYYSSMNNLGLVYYHFLLDDSMACYWFNKAISTKPNYSEAIYNLSKVKLRQNDILECLSLLRKSWKYDSTNIFILNDIANIYYFYLHQKDSAIFFNNKIIIMDSTTDKPYINLGNYALTDKDTILAVKYWELAISKNRNNPALLYGLSRYFKQNNNDKKAMYYNNLLYQQQVKHYDIK